MADKRAELLMETANALIQATAASVLTNEPLRVFRAETIAGPRAGAVRLFAGLDAGTLYRTLAADRAAVARQFISWRFFGEPEVYMDGRAVRVEAPWPPELAQDTIRLKSVCRQPKGNGRWVLGINEIGQTIIGALNDRTPNWLIGGTTGSGKTVALLSAGLQLSWDPSTRLVLLDGKMGSGLFPLVNLPGVVGPLATDVDTIRDALGWVYNELLQRYGEMSRQGERVAQHFPHILVLFDEFQDATTDPTVAELISRIVSKGRAARIHAILATHHPTVDAFGEDKRATRRNLPGRIALKVLDAKASEIVIGAPIPRADRLTGAGDAYTIGAHMVHRTQLVLVEQGDLEEEERQPPILDTWPPFRAEDLGQQTPGPRWSYNGEELAHGLAAAHQEWGRPRLQESLDQAGLGRPGSVRADRLLRLCREQLAELHKLGFRLDKVMDVVDEGGEVSVDNGSNHKGTWPGEIVDVIVL